MAQGSSERLAKLVEELQQNPGLVEQLPSREGAMVRDALEGQSVYDIAQNYRVSEAAVWGTLGNAARFAVGGPVESGGFGSDTAPGVTGGYGDTGFGSLGNEPPYPVSEEPEEQSRG